MAALSSGSFASHAFRSNHNAPSGGSGAANSQNSANQKQNDNKSNSKGLFHRKNSADPDFSEFEAQSVRFKPEALDQLCRCTKFSKKELKVMYRGFKQECPAGVVDEDTFKGIYAQFFPLGADSSHYAHYVFNTFDSDRNGSISFKEFVVGLSVLSRGTDLEKLQWAFSLYDINGDGYITKEEMTSIVTAIYGMMGRYADPIVEEDAPRNHVERIFQKMDHNGDGVISLEEFMETCRNDDAICKSISMFDTVF